MAIKALPKFIPEWFTPESQEEESTPTRFKLQGLTGPQFLEVQSEVSQSGGGMILVTGRGLNIAVNYGLTDWENFTDDDGEELPCTRGNIARIPMEILSELSSKIMDLSSVSEDERKNSSSQ